MNSRGFDLQKRDFTNKSLENKQFYPGEMLFIGTRYGEVNNGDSLWIMVSQSNISIIRMPTITWGNGIGIFSTPWYRDCMNLHNDEMDHVCVLCISRSIYFFCYMSRSIDI